MRRMILSMLLFAVLPVRAAAHDTWIRPEKPAVRPGQPVRLEATSGMEFPKLESPIKPDRVARAAYRLGSETKIIDTRTPQRSALGLTFRPERAGVAVVWIESKPRTLDLKPAEVEEYLAEIGAENAARQWSGAGKGRWHETYSKHAKTFVSVGEGHADSAWAQPVGMTLEIVSERDPTRLAAGGELAVRVLRDGNPVPGLAVVAQPSGEKQGSPTKTDTDGRASFILDRPGWWLLKATQLEPGSAAGDWTSHFTTLTVFVGNK